MLKDILSKKENTAVKINYVPECCMKRSLYMDVTQDSRSIGPMYRTTKLAMCSLGLFDMQHAENMEINKRQVGARCRRLVLMMVRRSLPRPSKSVAGKPFSRPHDDLAAYLHAQSLVTLPFDCANNKASAVLFSRRTA